MKSSGKNSASNLILILVFMVLILFLSISKIEKFTETASGVTETANNETETASGVTETTNNETALDIETDNNLSVLRLSIPTSQIQTTAGEAIVSWSMPPNLPDYSPTNFDVEITENGTGEVISSYSIPGIQCGNSCILKVTDLTQDTLYSVRVRIIYMLSDNSLVATQFSEPIEISAIHHQNIGESVGKILQNTFDKNRRYKERLDNQVKQNERIRKLVVDVNTLLKG